MEGLSSTTKGIYNIDKLSNIQSVSLLSTLK